VTALADRVLAGRDDAEHRVEDRRAARELARARQHEPAGPIVEECRVVDPQPRPDHRVVLVTGGADCVEAAIRLLQLAGGHVELSRRDLVLEQCECRCDGQLAAFSKRGSRLEPRGRRLRGVEIAVELALDDVDTVPGHAVVDDSLRWGRASHSTAAGAT
jgi:hypothetical protein